MVLSRKVTVGSAVFGRVLAIAAHALSWSVPCGGVQKSVIGGHFTAPGVSKTGWALSASIPWKASECPQTLESGEFAVRIRTAPLVKYEGALCQEFYRHTLFDGVCSWMWGFEQQIDYQIFTRSRPAQGVVTEEFVDLGHNYEPFNGISKIIVPQTLSAVGSFSDRLTWILRDTPAQAPYYRRFGQVFYLNDAPFLVNIVQQRIAEPYRFQNTFMSIQHLPVTNAVAIALIEARANKK